MSEYRGLSHGPGTSSVTSAIAVVLCRFPLARALSCRYTTHGRRRRFRWRFASVRPPSRPALVAAACMEVSGGSQASCSPVRDRHGVWSAPVPRLVELGRRDRRSGRGVDPAQGLWYLRGELGVTTFYYGNPGDYPILGDWDCTAPTPRACTANPTASSICATRTRKAWPTSSSSSATPATSRWPATSTATAATPSRSTARPKPGLHHQRARGERRRPRAAEYAYYFGNPGDKPLRRRLRRRRDRRPSGCTATRPAWCTSATATPRGSPTARSLRRPGRPSRRRRLER